MALWQAAKANAIDPVRRAAFETLYHGWVPLAYYNSRNWGDALSPVIVGYLSGQPVKYMPYYHQHRYLAIGSILQYANRRAEVWGSGFLWGNEKLSEPPQAVHAVRGPRSRAHLLRQGIDCPEIYGDPALLLPCFFNPRVEKKFEVGIVPHYIDKDHSWMARYANAPKVRIIDVEGGIPQFVEAVKSCELIVSSSLHGLICADAYGVANLWVEFSDRLYGRSFKFFDYFESVGRDTTTPVWVGQMESLGKVTACHRQHTLKIDLQPLIASCPFIDPCVKEKLSGSATA